MPCRARRCATHTGGHYNNNGRPSARRGTIGTEHGENSLFRTAASRPISTDAAAVHVKIVALKPRYNFRNAIIAPPSSGRCYVIRTFLRESVIGVPDASARPYETRVLPKKTLRQLPVDYVEMKTLTTARVFFVHLERAPMLRPYARKGMPR